MTRWRRLDRGYEQRLDVSEAMILITLAGIYFAGMLTPDFQKAL